MENGESSIHYKANVVGNGTFQYNREIVVRRIPCEGLVSNIVCECLGRRLREVTRALAPQMRKEPMPCTSSPFKMTFAALSHRFRGSLEKNELTWVSGPLADPVETP